DWSGRRRTFVEHQPVQTKLPGRFGEVVEIYWLPDVTVDAELVAADYVALFIRRGKDDDRQHARGFVLANAAQYFKAVELGEFEVEQHHLGPQALFAQNHVDGFFAITRDPDIVGNVGLLESADRQQLMIGIVFYEEYQFTFAHSSYPNVNQKWCHDR